VPSTPHEHKCTVCVGCSEKRTLGNKTFGGWMGFAFSIGRALSGGLACPRLCSDISACPLVRSQPQRASFD